MIGGGAVAIVLGGLAMAFVLAPLLRRDAARTEERSEALSHARGLQSRHDQLLGSLKDLEDDRATGKIDDQDYEELRARLSAEAVEVMRELDGLEKDREEAAEARRRASQPLVHPGAKRPGHPR